MKPEGSVRSGMEYEAALEEARIHVHSKNYDKALVIFEGLIDEIEKIDMFADDEASEYHSFDELYEEILYQFLHKPTKTIRPAHPLMARIYAEYGALLVELNRLEEAREALRAALRWNPMYAGALFEYAETFKMEQDWEGFMETTRRAFKIVFRPLDLARCYRNAASYFVEKELYDAAVGCLEMSVTFDPECLAAQAERFRIHEQTNGAAGRPSPAELRQIGETYGIPIGADRDVVGLALAIGRNGLEKRQKAAARYYLTIAYNLTRSQSIEALLKQAEEL